MNRTFRFTDSVNRLMIFDSTHICFVLNFFWTSKRRRNPILLCIGPGKKFPLNLGIPNTQVQNTGSATVGSNGSERLVGVSTLTAMPSASAVCLDPTCPPFASPALPHSTTYSPAMIVTAPRTLHKRGFSDIAAAD